jgi:ribonucleoside-diphosphate reductase alpha chain
MKIVEPKLSENALEVVKKRYLKTDMKGVPVETPGEMMWRVARFVAKADMNYNGLDVEHTADEFYKMMTSLDFLPGGRVLFEAGNDAFNQLSHCFVLGIEDSITSIFKTLGEAAVIQKNDGGTGFNFSRIRPHGDKVKSVPGAASGPVDFIEVFDAALGRILQGGKRHGGNMAVLNCDHPDILDFIKMKSNDGLVRNFNISVGVSDKFMNAVENNKNWQLISPRTNEITRELRARDLFNEILENAWKTGDPGMVFLDRMEGDNPTPSLGKLDATNPCGEQPLLPYESCNLGSVVLSNFVLDKRTGRQDNNEQSNKRIDWERLGKTVRIAIHFLDNIIDVNSYVLPEIENLVKMGNRKIGLGVMGFAEMLFKLNVSYASKEAVDLMEKIMAFIQKNAMEESTELASKRGAFPNFDISVDVSTQKRFDGKKRRNATMITIAPTGTISMVANTSSGIEPVFSLSYVRQAFYEDTRNKNGGSTKMVFVDPEFSEVARKMKFYSEKLMEKIAEEGSIQNIKEIPEEVKKVFVTTHDIDPQWHVKVQAACQKYADNSVSKTINFRSDATVSDVEKAYMMAWKLGCKGITIYRDGSKNTQVLTNKIMTHAVDLKEVCPECGGKMLFKEGCATCSVCSYSYCKN